MTFLEAIAAVKSLADLALKVLGLIEEHVKSNPEIQAALDAAIKAQQANPLPPPS